MFSPRFKSVAEMAGWDEEALLLASLVVEDTPERNLKDKKRSDLYMKSPPTSSRRKRRRARPSSIPISILNLDEDEDSTNTHKKEAEKGKNDSPKKPEETIKVEEKEKTECSSSSTLACMDRLREELSCAICLEICYEPSTTPCGHSFCKNCLKSAADKCGKRCPKCRQLISNGRSCTINAVLWNTIQLLFPAEVESRKAAAAATMNSRTSDQRKKSPQGMMSSASNQANNSNRNLHLSRRMRALRRLEEANSRSLTEMPNQDEDAALALRLQREEFMEIYRGSSLARDNLRAMARRAMNLARNDRFV